jgi:hypothetical protein
VNREIGDPLEVGGRLRVQLDDQIKGDAAIEHASDGCARETRLDRFGHILNGQAVSGHRLAIEHETNERDIGLLLERDVSGTLDAHHHVAHALSEPP